MRRAEDITKSTESSAAGDPDSTAEVDLGDRTAVERWTHALGLTDEALLSAVQAVGTRVYRIKDYLGAGSMAADPSSG